MDVTDRLHPSTKPASASSGLETEAPIGTGKETQPDLRAVFNSIQLELCNQILQEMRKPEFSEILGECKDREHGVADLTRIAGQVAKCLAIQIERKGVAPFEQKDLEEFKTMLHEMIQGCQPGQTWTNEDIRKVCNWIGGILTVGSLGIVFFGGRGAEYPKEHVE